jgi:hypothetical protein
MPTYPPLDRPPPKIYTSDHFQSADAAMQTLAVVNHILEKCERCQWPVEAQRAECDGLADFYESFNAEWRGPGTATPEVLSG